MTAPSSLLTAQTIGAQLDDLLAGRWLPATSQTRIHSPSELPVRVERCIRVLGPHTTWRAYTDSAQQTFCAIARVRSLGSSRTTTAALEVRFLDSDAQVYAGAVWHDCNPGWRVHSILQLPETIARPDLRRGREALIRVRNDCATKFIFWSD